MQLELVAKELDDLDARLDRHIRALIRADARIDVLGADPDEDLAADRPRRARRERRLEESGVRPDQSAYVPVEARVEVVEFLGHEFQLHLSAGGQTFVARVDTRSETQPGAPLRVGFDKSKLHVFDKETGEAVA